MDNDLKTLFEELYKAPPAEVVPLKAHASDRKIYRLRGAGHTVCGVQNPYPDENKAFIYFAKHFKRHGLPVPTVLIESTDNLSYLLEDLGDTTIYDLLAKSRTTSQPFPQHVKKLYERAVTYLPKFQVTASRDINYANSYKVSAFDEASMLYDMNYFLNCFLRKTGISFDEQQLTEEFKKFAAHLMKAPIDFFMYRDFQARNIMVRAGELFFIDFQGGRKGPLQYDVASLLYQSSAQIPQEERDDLCLTYIAALEKELHDDVKKNVGSIKDWFLSFFDRFVIVRMLQVLGTYGKQGLENGKDYFAKSIPPAICTIHTMAKREPCMADLPELNNIFQKLKDHEQFGSPSAS